MKNTTMTLEDVQRALHAQDRELLTAYDALIREAEGRLIVLPSAKLACLHETCAVQTASTASTTNGGLRC
jgi:hypothetical protein